MAYELTLEKFKGPLDKLLELIEEKKLEITEISLAAVTDDFLKYLKSLNNANKNSSHREIISENSGEIRDNLRLIADFVAVASRLLLIKSKSLLPDAPLTSEEEAEIKDLEFRLKHYRDLKVAMKTLAKEWKKGEQSFSRPYFLNAMSAADKSVSVFYPGSNCTPEALIASLEKILEGYQKFISEEGTVEAEIVSIEAKIQEIVSRLQKLGELSFGTLAEKNSRIEIITAFLAILHMAHDQLVLLDQASHFSDITIKTRLTSQ